MFAQSHHETAFINSEIQIQHNSFWFADIRLKIVFVRFLLIMKMSCWEPRSVIIAAGVSVWLHRCQFQYVMRSKDPDENYRVCSWFLRDIAKAAEQIPIGSL